MVVVTAMADGAPVGFVVGSFTSISLDPPLVGFFADQSSTTYPKVERAGAFCANVLSSDHSHLCRQFSSKSGDRFAGTTWRPAPSGSPILDEAVAWVDCDLHDTVVVGDHTLSVGRVRSLSLETHAAPLIFHRGAYVTGLHQSDEAR